MRSAHTDTDGENYLDTMFRQTVFYQMSVFVCVYALCETKHTGRIFPTRRIANIVSLAHYLPVRSKSNGHEIVVREWGFEKLDARADEHTHAEFPSNAHRAGLITQ